MKPFGLAKKQLRTFSDPLLDYLPASFAPEAVSDSEYEDLESLAQLANEQIVKERIEKLGVDLPKEQMTEKLLFNDGERAVVSGMRFRNLDLTSPYVALKANFRINEAETVRLLKSLVMKTYGDADPLGFTVWEQPGLDLGQTSVWSVVVAGGTDVPVIDPPTKLTLRWPDSIADVYDQLKAEHEAWALSQPELSKFVNLENQSDLEDAASKGHLLALYDLEGLTGLVAGRSFPLFGKEALHLTELFLFQRLRGQGLGRMLESQFISRLQDDFEIVWGSINRMNIPALNTALSLGRMPLQQEYFFSLSAD